MEPHRKGDLTEAVVIAELKRRDIPVATPVGDNERWDLAIETPSGALVRVQIKTGWMKRGAVTSKAVSQHTNAKGHRYKAYEDDVDVFIVYSEDQEELYLVSEAEVGQKMSLPVEEPDQTDHTINWASDFARDTRWPPDGAAALTSFDSHDPVRESAIRVLTNAGSEVYTAIDGETGRRLLAEHDGEVLQSLLLPGWVVDGRIRFIDRSTKSTDCIVVHCEELDQLYVIPDDEFDSTMTLRVAEPEKRNRRTNYAQDYEIGVNWPPTPDPHPDHRLDPAIAAAVECFERTDCEVAYDKADGTNRTLIVDTPADK